MKAYELVQNKNMFLIKNKILYLFNTEIQNFRIFILVDLFLQTLQCYFIGNKNLNNRKIDSNYNIII